MTQGKRYEKIRKLVEPTREYKLKEALDILKQCATCKFDESVEVTMNLNVDPKQNDQQIRGTVVLPNGTGKTKKVYVIAKGEKSKETSQKNRLSNIIPNIPYQENRPTGWTANKRLPERPNLP